MKWSRSFLLTLIYGLFTILYTVYIISHPGYFHWKKGPHWGYYLKFLLIGNYLYFIFQGLILKSRNWGILLLLPPALLLASILVGYLLVGLVRLGGGDLLNWDSTDMMLETLLLVGGSWFCLRYIDQK